MVALFYDYCCKNTRHEVTLVPSIMIPLRIYCIKELRLCCPTRNYFGNLCEVVVFNINACEAMQSVSGNICMLTVDREEIKDSTLQHKFV
jgi:hypothetical protein